jgi:replicative DNA helicase
MSERRYMPVDSAAEAAVIGAILVSPAAFDEVADVLVADDFGVPALKEIYSAIAACDASGRPVDVVTVTDELRRAKQLSKAGGPESVAGYADNADRSENVVAHANIVAGKAQLRRVIEAGRAMVAEGSAPDADSDEVRNKAEQEVFNLGREAARSSLVGMAEAVPALLDDIARSRNQLLVGHSTGLSDLDKATAGFQPGQLIVAAARPGVGKTSLALQIARHVSETTNLSVPFISYEMNANELTIKMLSAAVGISAGQIRSGEFPAEANRDIAVQAEKMAGVPLFIDDNPPEDIGALRSQMRRLARRTELGMIVVDYMQLMAASSNRGNRNEEVSEISRGLKQLARELNVPVLALSQLSRANEVRPNKRPVLSDLRDSGSIEQDANTVIFLYRDSMYNQSAEEDLAEIIIAKQRSGASGITVHTEFHAECTRFKDTNRRPAASAPAGTGAPQHGGARPF